eukprot:g6095.t1
MRAVYDNDVAERRRIERTEGGLGGETDLQEFDAAGIASADISPAAGPREAARLQAIRHVAKRHFVLFDAKPHLVVRATEPERMPLETLSEPMLRLLSDRGFLDHVAELMPGTRRMRGWNLKLHSTVAGALCVQFVFDLSEAGICEWSETFPARRRGVEEVAPKDEHVPLHVHPMHGGGSCPLERLAELYPDVRFVATAKKVCKMAIFRQTGGHMETLSSSEAEGITQSDVIKRCVLHEELKMRDVVEDLSLDAAAAGAGEVGRGRQAQCPPPAQVGCDTTHICRYEQVLGSFSNPNPHIAIATAEWLRYVVRKNLRNDVEGRGPFAQYKDICLNWVLVDPPREGLDEITRQLVAQFDHVLYVSCSPTSLRRDLDFFLHDKGSHTLQEFCMLDHFPFTAHIENAVYLRAKKLAAKEQASGGGA